MTYEYKLPSLGDDVTGKVLEILVQPGDEVQNEQIVLIVGTDKVDAEMPIDAAGTIEEILVKVGDDVTDGTPILRMKQSGGGDAPAAKEEVPAPPPVAEEKPVATTAAAPAPTPAPEPSQASAPSGKDGLRASPLARKRAKEFGINLSDVRPAEGASRISYKDVLEHVKKRMNTGGGAAGGAMAHKPLPNFEKFGPVVSEEQSRIGVLTADNMVYAFNAIPHAWISEKADITRLEELRQQYKDQVKEQGGSLTTTAILAKAVCAVLRKMPQFNASYDPETRTVLYKKYYNIGIAVDTPRGLLVPVIKDADKKSLTEISVELSELSKRTRDGKNKPTDLEGGSFSISNIGGIGGTNMISIVNWPEVSILSITAANYEPRWNGSEFEPRLMMPMTIGWDHRVINGADAARFLKELKSILEEPFLGWL
jgi:pyruvate dehydrogenase E2 component (dihydrolipoamide acetyltransferase)